MSMAQIWSHFGRPIGPRASAIVTSTPNSLKALTKTPIGANEPKSIIVPAQSKTTALNLARISLQSQTVDDFFAKRETSRGARPTGYRGDANMLFRRIGEDNLRFRRHI